MIIVNDPRKKDLYNLLRALGFQTIHENYEGYYKLKKLYDKLLYDIFGKDILKGNSEGFYWDQARNKLEEVFSSIKIAQEAKKRGNILLEEKANLLKTKALNEFSEKIKILEKFI